MTHRLTDELLSGLTAGYTDMIVTALQARWAEWSDTPINVKVWSVEPTAELKSIPYLAAAETRYGLIAMGCGSDAVDALDALKDSLLYLRTFGKSDDSTDVYQA